MAFEIFLHPTAATGGPKAFNAGVSRALTAIGAQHSAAAETVRLSDRTQVHLFLDGDDDIALLTTETVTPAVAAAVWRIAEETSSMVSFGGAFYALPAAGQIPGGLALGFPGAQRVQHPADLEGLLGGVFEDFQAGEATEVLRKEAVAKAVNDRRTVALKARKPLPDLVSAPSHSLLRRLSDALFGRSL
ncbi:MAG: hypothetical protein Q7T61_05235 [Caulobacter sp.]|nr:hypothetical protein [Caulobacter sp.]